MIKAAVAGATGYAGMELVRLLAMHPDVEIVSLGSERYQGQRYTDIYPHFHEPVNNKSSIVSDKVSNKEGTSGDWMKLECVSNDLEAMAKEADVVFTATPQGFCGGRISRQVLNEAKVIDLSADFRIKDSDVYTQWYKLEHGGKEYIKEAVYGLCEIHREDIKKASLIANPGCYSTCSILTLYPLLKHDLIEKKSIVIDAKSGTSGAGRGEKVQNLFCEVNENIKAYSVTNHRHTPEIEQELSLAAGSPVLLSFTPHLVPMMRGILVTAYASLKEGVTKEMIHKAYEQEYGGEFFIRLLGEDPLPQTRWVKGSNFVDLGFKVDERTSTIIAMGALDNLVKGAAGAALQNMNILFSLPEERGLEFQPDCL